ncbi:immunity protein Imm33 domain-containing protein, partial [Halomonas cupida]
GECSDAADFFKPLHIEHIKDFFPHVEKYLALSPNHKFIVDRNGYEDVWVENE